MAALKHIWIEGAVAEPGALVCSLAACPVSAQQPWGLSLSRTGLEDTLYPQLLSLTFVALFLHLQQSREYLTVEQCVKLLQKIKDRVLIIL